MKAPPFVIKRKIRLADFNPGYCGGLEKEETKPKTDRLGQRIGELQDLLYANSSHAVLLIFQGVDASGKDGSGRSVLKQVNPLGVETANFKVPSSEERAHDYLWRVHKAAPRLGNIDWPAGTLSRRIGTGIGIMSSRAPWLQRWKDSK
ncbi:MAG TPA: hypothetical protein VFT34_04610 [Verrucomicrobiae bacterium]|nr:hypothetical protein [Verrucomicrobiae bacterium]